MRVKARECQSVAGIVVDEKNRCLLVGALDARPAGVQGWTLRAGRDNLAVHSIPVTQSVSYT